MDKVARKPPQGKYSTLLSSTTMDGKVDMELTGSANDNTTDDKWTRDGSFKISFLDDNPHRKGTALHRKYEDAKSATTVGQAKEKGASACNLKEWREKERIILGSAGVDGGGGTRGNEEEEVKEENKEGEKRKLDFRGAGEGGEPGDVEEERRQEDLEKIRKLEGVKEKLSPTKKKREN